jgi:hypothetical protein
MIQGIFIRDKTEHKTGTIAHLEPGRKSFPAMGIYKPFCICVKDSFIEVIGQV